MKKHTYLWVVIAVVLIIGGLTWYRQWQMDNLISGLDLNLQNSLLSEITSSEGVDYLVPPNQIFDSGSELPPLNDPHFTTITDADTYLSDAVDGVALEINGSPYFFSYQILN